MDTSDEKLQSATDRHVAGNLRDARRLYEQILLESPTKSVARFRLGLLELQEQSPQTALPLIERAVAESPDQVKFQLGLGQVLNALQRWDEAAAVYRRILMMDASSADAHFSLGFALQSAGDYHAAVSAYQSATKLQQDFPDALNNLGNCFRLTGDVASAEAAYRQAILVNPSHCPAVSNLATLLQSQGDFKQAIELFRQAVQLEPDASSHRLELGLALTEHRQFAEAQTVLRGILKRDIGNPDAWLQIGNIHTEQGQFKLAASAYESAIRARPGFLQAINNTCVLLRKLGRLEEAELHLRKAIQENDSFSGLYDTLGNVLKDAGQPGEAIDCFRKAVELDPANALTHSNLLCTLSFAAVDPAPILTEARRWNGLHAARMPSQTVRFTNTPAQGRRIRIGYVSPDFRDHCQALFMMPLLSHHDHREFEIFCYSSVERTDAVTHRLAGLAGCWREVAHLDDAAFCELIRADGIDILVDLTMHMAHCRPLLFARRAAPVQVAWLAYPGTTGIIAMDYRLSDPRLDPPGFETHYTEKTLRLPDSFWCYDPLTSEPEVNELPAIKAGHLTLGCLNNPCKLTDRTIELWGRVMRAIPTSQLLLMAAEGLYRRRLLRQFAEQGVDSARIDFVPRQSRADYLRTYHRIDLGLDTFPYNGHTTSLDSLWMGVPVITRIGQTCVGRGGLSQLFQLDLLEFASDSHEGFVNTAVTIANDLRRLALLRRHLRARLTASPLMDAPRFARNIEAIYKQLATTQAVRSTAA